MVTSSAIIELPSSSNTSDETPFTKFVLSRMADEAQNMFVITFAEHIKRDPDAQVIDFDNVFRWLGFNRKDNAIRLLTREFKCDEYIFVKGRHLLNAEGSGGGSTKDCYLISMNQFEELMIAAHTEEGKQARKLVLTLKRAVVEYMQQEIEKSRNDKLTLQDENTVLKDQLKPRGHFLYLFKNNRDEPDTWCYMKAGSAKDVDTRVKPFIQISPKGLLVLVIELEVKSEKELQNLEATIHRFLKYTGFFVGVSDRAETYLGNIEKVKQIMRVLVDLFNIVSQDENWETLQHMVAVCNEELRDAPIQQLSSEPLALSEVQHVRQQLQKLVDMQTRATLQPLTEFDDADDQVEEEHSDESSDDEVFEEGNAKAYDFKRFIDECCEKGPDFEEVNVVLSGRHKVWSRCMEKGLHGKLIAYLKKKFTPVRMTYKKQRVHGFAGVRVKPVELDYTEIPTQAQQFLKENCAAAPEGKLFDIELRSKFVEWRGDNQDVVEAELRELKKFLHTNYPHSSLWNGLTRCNQYGYYGISLNGLEDRFIKRLPNSTARAVCLLDAKTGRIKRRWGKVADAAAALGLDSSSISYSIQHQKRREGGYLQYADQINLQETEEAAADET